MRFRNCCCAILKKNGHEVDYGPVEEMDWFELTLGKSPSKSSFPSGKNFPLELYKRLVNPAADETQRKIIKSMGKANHQKALRALASPFMQVVDTVKQEVANNKVKDNKSSDLFGYWRSVLEYNQELRSQLVANPKLRTMRGVLEEFTPNWKMLLLNCRYYIKRDDLAREIECRFPIDDPETREETLEKILKFLNRLTEFVVYLHKTCWYPKAMMSSWHSEQLEEIDKVAVYYRTLYAMQHFDIYRRRNFRSDTISESIRLMQKHPKGPDFISFSGPVLHKLGLLYPCGNLDHWPSYFNRGNLFSWNLDIFLKSAGKKDFGQMFQSVVASNMWIYMMLYLHSLAMEECGLLTIRMFNLLTTVRNTVEFYGGFMLGGMKDLFTLLFPEFAHEPFVEHGPSGVKLGYGEAARKHIEKICQIIMMNKKLQSLLNKPKDIQFAICDGSSGPASESYGGSQTSEERSDND